MENSYRYLFGPVPSRRFGQSLGVDLTPLKTCDLDCVFCQLGRTTHQTVARGEFVPVREVLAELRRWLKTGPGADVITLSGSGEPTLHSHFGKVLDFVKKKSGIPSVLLTNGTLLHLNDTIYSMLLRRPCTSEQISRAFGMHINEVLKHLGRLVRQNRIRAEYKQRNVYYVVV